jgi:hypothetical protein
VLELAADLRLFHESANQIGLILVRIEQDLDGKVASEVGISSLEDNSHASAGNLTQELNANRPVGQ